MPPLLEIVLIPIVVWAALFLLMWPFARDKLSRGARVAGWLAVAVAAISFLWSLWFESLLPYLRTERTRAALLMVLQAITMVTGTALLVHGAWLFLAQWRKLMVQGDAPMYGATRGYMRGDHQTLRRIRSQPLLADRLKLAFALIGNMLLRPGLGRVAIGLGITVAGAQILEPDPSMIPSTSLIVFAVLLMLSGLLQEWAAGRRTRQGRSR